MSQGKYRSWKAYSSCQISTTSERRTHTDTANVSLDKVGRKEEEKEWQLSNSIIQLQFCKEARLGSTFESACNHIRQTTMHSLPSNV